MPPISAITALAARYAALPVSVLKQKSAEFFCGSLTMSYPPGHEAREPTAKPFSFRPLNVVLISVGETPNTPNAL